MPLLTPLPRCLTAALAIALCATATLHVSAAEAAVRTMIVTSDPQYPWTDATDSHWPETDETRDSRSRQLIEEQYRSIAAYRAARPDEDIPVFVNGDLTAYGHGWQRKVMAELLTILGDNVHLGLGNHDYANNIRQADGSGCANNGCARDSVLDMKRHVIAKDKVSFDFGVLPGGLSNVYAGSLAYAVEAPGWGRVLQMQLHNYPGYAVAFDSREGLLPAAFRIESSMPWLATTLDTHLAIPKYGTAADRAFDFGIVHMHDADGGGDGLGDVLKAGHVAAVFAGHLHRRVGRYRNIGEVPVYLSGSASQRTYLIVEHDTDTRRLRIFTVENNNPEQRKLVDDLPLDTI